jgi:hypothetical protein
VKDKRNWIISAMDLTEMGCECMNWINLSQDRVQWRILLLAILKFEFYYLLFVHSM